MKRGDILIWIGKQITAGRTRVNEALAVHGPKSAEFHAATTDLTYDLRKARAILNNK